MKKYLIFLFIFLLILFSIIFYFCVNCKDTFKDVDLSKSNEAKEEIEKMMKNKSINDSALRDYFEKNRKSSLYVIIDKNGNYLIKHDKIIRSDDPRLKNFKLMMENTKKRYHKLPECTFIQNIGDRQINNSVGIFENSSLEDAILSPLWYYMTKPKIEDIKKVKKKWREKIKKAVWRGSSTGFSMNDFRIGDRISRKYVVDRSLERPDLLDAGFTNFCDFGKKIEKMYKTHETMSPIEQLNYKYIISMDGNGGTYGLYWVLNSGSLCLNNSTYRQWFTPFFRDGEHFISFNDNKDTHNIIKLLEGINDNVAHSISIKSTGVAEKLFNDDFVSFYMYQLLKEYSKKQSTTDYQY